MRRSFLECAGHPMSGWFQSRESFMADHREHTRNVGQGRLRFYFTLARLQGDYAYKRTLKDMAELSPPTQHRTALF